VCIRDGDDDFAGILAQAHSSPSEKQGAIEYVLDQLGDIRDVRVKKCLESTYRIARKRWWRWCADVLFVKITEPGNKLVGRH